MTNTIETVHIHARADSSRAIKWEARMQEYIKEHRPEIRFSEDNVDLLIVLGGDGTMLDAAHAFRKMNPLIMGLNLGTIGFLTAESGEEQFLKAIQRVLTGEYQVSKRMTIDVTLQRDNQQEEQTHALNEVSVQSLIGVVHLDVSIDGYTYQYIRGNGVLAATPTGSTAFNLSAHGPIMMPETRGIIISELLDHNVPTPSLIATPDKEIQISVESFRQHDTFRLEETDEPVDVILSADGRDVCAIQAGDIIHINASEKDVRFVQLDDNQFLKRIHDTFAIR